MNPSDNPREQIRHAPEDKLSGPRPRGLLLDLLAAGVEAGSLQPTLGGDSGPFRFGSIGHGIEVAEVCLLVCFAFLTVGSWISGRHGHPVPGPLHEQARKPHGNFVVVQYAETNTIRQSLRTAKGSRAKRREKAYVFGSSRCPGVGDDIEAGASVPSRPFPPPPLPPLSIDEVLQKSVRGFREKWWPPPYTAAAFEDAPAEEAEGDFGGSGGCDMHPETKVFLEKHVYAYPSTLSISRTCPAVNETCPAVDEGICFLPSPSAANAAAASFKSTAEETTGRTRAEPPGNIMSQSVIAGFAPPSTSRACPAVVEGTCFLPSPSAANTTSASFNSASAEETTGRARADMTNNDIVESIIADIIASVVSSTPAVVRPTCRVESLSVVAEEEPESVLSRVESGLPPSQAFALEPTSADMEEKVNMEEEEEEIEEEGEDDDEEREEWEGEEEESLDNALLLLPVTVAVSAEERTSMTTKLIKILRGLNDPLVAVCGEYLARNCSLSHSEDNRHLTWHNILGEGAFGRVTLVSHELGKYAVKELTEEAGPDEKWAARNEMETILSVSDHPNIIRVVAMDPTLSTMPMMMEAGSMDMFDVVYNMTIPMRTKIRLLLGTGRGLGHMHAKRKVHRDVKAENILVVGGEDDTAPLTAKVADFGMTCDIGTRTEVGTGSPGYIPVENLRDAIEAGPDGDVFSFAVLMLFIFVKEELRESNMFAHSLLLTAEERVELDGIYHNGGDSGEVFTFQCQVKDRVMYDGSFDDIMLLPERLDDSVPSKSRVLEMLWRCLSTDRTFRPSMEEVVAMLEGLLEEED